MILFPFVFSRLADAFYEHGMVKRLLEKQFDLLSDLNKSITLELGNENAADLIARDCK